MDFLASLNLDNVPEQQTRTSHNSELVKALSSNPGIKLGFDSCCNCGLQLSSDEAKSNILNLISCKKCKRVWYCSERCRKEDSNPTTNNDNDNDNEQSSSMGHGSIICALLRLCNVDEDEEEKMMTEITQKQQKQQLSKKQEESRDRIRSEYESYPATMANIVMDGPCYQPILKKIASSSSSKNNLIIHCIGASLEAELWNANLNKNAKHKHIHDLTHVVDCYADAFTEMAEQYSISNIQIVFVGPDCLADSDHTLLRRTLHISSSNSDSTDHSHQKKKIKKHSQIEIHTHASMYNHKFLKQLSSSKTSTNHSISKPDIIVFFNPGFTCPDYDWDDALSSLPPSHNDNDSENIPFLITTNTEMEAVMDCQYLFERQCIPKLPNMVKAMIDAEEQIDEKYPVADDFNYDHDDDEDYDALEGETDSMFFGQNPFAGSRVRQSGTMANDMFVKNMWMFGGPSLSKLLNPKSKPNKSSNSLDADNKNKEQKRPIGEVNHVEGERDIKKKRKKKRHEIVGKGNSKKKNPALI